MQRRVAPAPAPAPAAPPGAATVRLRRSGARSRTAAMERHAAKRRNLKRRVWAVEERFAATAAALEASGGASMLLSAEDDPALAHAFWISQWVNSGVRARARPRGPVDKCIIVCAAFVGFVLACVVFGFTLLPLVDYPSWQPGCLVAQATGLVCNGQGACVGGFCVKSTPQWSGAALDQNACAYLGGFNASSNEPCNGFGLCSPTMQFADVPLVCQIYGWNDARCQSYIRPWYAFWQAARNNQTVLQAYPQLAGVPICVCTSGSRDGPACEYEGCPTGDNGEICSGYGDPNVGLFANGTDVCHGECNGCRATHVFDFLDPAEQQNFSTAALVTIQQHYLDQLSKPVAGYPIIYNNSVIINRGALVGDFTTSFVCACDETQRFGPVCNQGACPDVNGVVCNGHGLKTAGAGYVAQTAQQLTAACTPICVAGTSPCTAANAGQTCGPSSTPELFAQADWCAATQVPDPASGYLWRCASGTLVQTSAKSPGLCALGYTSAALDPAAYPALRAAARLDLTLAADFDTLAATALVPDNSTSSLVFSNGTASFSTAFALRYQSPVSWYFFGVRNPSTTASVRVSIAVSGTSAAPQSQVLAPQQRANFYAAPQLTVPEVLAASFAPPPTPVFLTVLATSANRVQLVPVPFFENIPPQWNTVRLQAVADATLVVVDVQGYTAAFFSSSALPPPPNTYVALVQPQTQTQTTPSFQGAAASGFSGVVSHDMCVDAVSVCAWSFSATTGDAVSGGWVARYSVTTSQWIATPAPQASSALLTLAQAPVQSWTGLQGMLVGVGRTAITVATALGTGLNANAWTAQLEVLTPEWTLQITANASASGVGASVATEVVVDTIEVVQQSALEEPCLCEPPVITRTQNRTTQNAVWLAQSGRRTSAALQPGALVAVGFVSEGFPQTERGVVVVGTQAGVVEVAVDGFGTVAVQSSLGAAPLTQSEFAAGYDFSNPQAFPARCPTGYRTRTAAYERTVNETDAQCVMRYLDPVTSVAWEANCTFSENITCACVSGSVAQACECDASDDDVFAGAVWAFLQNAPNASACTTVNTSLSGAGAPLPPTEVTQPTFATAPFGDRGILGLVVVLATPSPSTCRTPTQVLGVDPAFNYSAPVTFVAACTSDNSTAHVTLEFSLTQPYPPVLVLYGLLAADRVFVISSPLGPDGGIPVPSEVSVYAASNNPQSAANAGTLFAAQPWSSGPASPGLVTPVVWLAQKFTRPQVVTRVFLGVSAAALEFANGAGVVPVNLGVDFLDEFSGVWVRAATLTSLAGATHGPESFVVAAPSAVKAANAVRVISRFPITISSLAAYTDQVCAVANYSGAAAALLPGVPVLNTQTAISGAASFEERSNANCTAVPNGCVCTDACAQANDGVCQDTTQYAKRHGLTFGVVTTPGVVLAQNTPAQLVAWCTAVSSWMFPGSGGQTLWLLYNSSAVGTPDYAVFAGILPFAQNSSLNLLQGNSSWYTAALTLTGTQQVVQTTGTPYPAFFNGTLWVGLGNAAKTGWLNSAGAFVNIPSTLCAAGTDCSDCGSSCRVAVVDAGLECAPSPFEQQVLDLMGSGQVPSDSRLVQEYLAAGATVLFTLPPLQRTEAEWGSACLEQVCTPFQDRCVDGSCAPSGACASQTQFTCPGNGCVASETNLQVYYCVCDRGWNGVACEFHESVAPDITNPNFDWYSAGECYAPPQMQQQPALSNFRAYEVPPGLVTLVQDNRKFRPRTFTSTRVLLPDGVTEVYSTTDVGWYNLRPRFGSGGYPYVRACRTPSGLTVYTDAPPAVLGPYGQYLLLDDCVRLRDEQGNVVAWQAFPSPHNGTVYIQWNLTQLYEASYDEACVRCPNRDTASDVAQCALSTHVPCNGNGVCMADGTCECADPYTTWMYTQAWTDYISTPYVAPQKWNQVTSNAWRVARTGVCSTLNCNSTDCSTPKACFPGTPSLAFVDALVDCGSAYTTPNTVQKYLNPQSAGVLTPSEQLLGQCAVSVSACQLGETTPALECAGHGRAFVVAYTTPLLMGCECGDPPVGVSLNASSLESWQLRPNGWGGRACNQYFCGVVGGKPQFVQYDAQNFNNFFTDLGIPIPGKWISTKTCSGTASQGVMTADPLEVAEWTRCCGAETRLERCDLQPCRVAGAVQCLAPQRCLPAGGSPLVYECSNHGSRTADGGCACQYDRAAGTGYFSSLANYSDANCYGVIQCPVAPNGRVCNACDAADVACWLSDPQDPGFNSQAQAYMLALGGNPSNQSIVLAVQPTITQYQDSLVQAANWYATATAFAIALLDACVCVYPGDNPANPRGMVPYNAATLGGLFASYKWPYQFNASFSVVLPLQNNVTRFPTSWAQTPTFGLINATWTTPATVYLVRVWCAVLAYAPNKNPATPVQLTVVDSASGATVCPLTAVAGTPPNLVTGGFAGTDASGNDIGNYTGWGWTTLVCVQHYSVLNLAGYDPTGSNTNCGPPLSAQAASAQCTGWKQSTCTSAGGTYLDINSLNQLYGCSAGECCVPSTGNFFQGTTNSVAVVAVGGTVALQALRVMGYTNTSLVPPAFFQAECNARTGGLDAAAYARPDYYAVQYALNVEDQSTFLPGDSLVNPQFSSTSQTQAQGAPAYPFCGTQTAVSWDQAAALCQNAAAFLAAPATDAETQQPNSPDLAAPILTNAQCGAQRTQSFAAAWVALSNTAAPPNPPLDDVLLQLCTDNGNFFNSPAYFALGARPPQFVASLPVSDWNSAIGRGVSRALGSAGAFPNNLLSYWWGQYFSAHRGTVPTNPCYLAQGLPDGPNEAVYLAKQNAPISLRCDLKTIAGADVTIPPQLPNGWPTNYADAASVAGFFNPATYAGWGFSNAHAMDITPDTDFYPASFWNWRSGSTFSAPNTAVVGVPTDYDTQQWTTPEYQQCWVRVLSSTDCSVSNFEPDSNLHQNIPFPVQAMDASAYVGPINSSPDYDEISQAYVFGNENPRLELWNQPNGALPPTGTPAEALAPDLMPFFGPPVLAVGAAARTQTGAYAIRSFQVYATSTTVRTKVYDQNSNLIGVVGGGTTYGGGGGGVVLDAYTVENAGNSYNCQVSMLGYNQRNVRTPSLDAHVIVQGVGNPPSLGNVHIQWSGAVRARTMWDGSLCFTPSYLNPQPQPPPSNAPPIPSPPPVIPNAPLMNFWGDQVNSYLQPNDANWNVYKFQFGVLNTWRSEEVTMGTASRGSDGSILGFGVGTNLNKLYTGRSYTNGWLTELYTCQAVDVRVAREISPGQALKTYAGYSHPDSIQSNWLLTKTPRLDGTLQTCALPPAEQCEVAWNSLFEWDSHENPGSGAFPDVQTIASNDIYLPQGSVANGNCFQWENGQALPSVQCPNYFHETARPLILEFGAGVTLLQPSGVVGILPGDGLLPLWRLAKVDPTSAPLGIVQALYKMYAWNNAGLTLATQFTEWTYGDCGAVQKWGVNPNTGATLPGLFIAYPCDAPLNYVCSYDFTKFTAVNGHACQTNGPNDRTTGAPRFNTTCFAEHPDAVQATNPAGFAALAAVQAGTLSTFVGEPIAFDAVMAWWLSINASIGLGLPNARNYLVQGYSTQPGATTRGVAPDYATGFNLDLAQIWPVDCGIITSTTTLQTARYLAYASAYCSPDAPQIPPQRVAQSQLPTALNGIPPSVTDATARYLEECAVTVVRVASYVQQDVAGDAMPSWQDYFQVVQAQSVGGLAVAPLVSAFMLANTGKNAALFLLQPGTLTTLAGVVSVTSSSPAPALFKVWVASMQYYYGTPASSQTLGSVWVTPNTGNVAWSFAINAPVGSLFQIVGFTFANATTVTQASSTIFVSDVVVTTAASIAQCRAGWAAQPRYGFSSSLKSPAAFNFCPMTPDDLLVCDGDCTIGACRCDASQCGPACAATCVATPTGTHGQGGGYGAPGLVVDPLGVVRQTSTTGWDNEMRGFYEFTDKFGVQHAAAKLFDPALVLYVRDQQLTSAYQSLVRTENAWVAQPYFAYTGTALPVRPTNTYTQVTNVADSLASALPSFENADDAILYAEACLNVPAYPIFAGYSQNNVDGLWYAEAQAVPVLADTGNYTTVSLPVVCPQAPSFAATPWPTGRCQAINSLNTAFNQTKGACDTDGTYLFATSGNYIYTRPTSAVLTVGNSTSLWIWYRLPMSAQAPTVTTPCSNVVGTITLTSGSAAGDMLAVYTCVPTPTQLTVTINYRTSVVGEVALFQDVQAGAALQCVFYPCE